MTADVYAFRKIARPNDRLADLVVCVLACTILLTCAVIYAGKRFAWFDEIMSVTLITDPSFFHMLVASTDQIGTPPLYYILGRAWVSVFGPSEAGLRIMTSLMTCCAFVLIWALMRQYYSVMVTAVGVCSAIFLSQLVLYQNAEIRFYSMYLMMVAVLCWSYVHAGRPNSSPGALVLNGFACLALCTTHAYGVFFIGMAVLATAITDMWEGRFRPLLHLSYILPVVVFLAIEIPIYVLQYSVQHQVAGLPKPSVMDLIDSMGSWTNWTGLTMACLFGMGTLLRLNWSTTDVPTLAPADEEDHPSSDRSRLNVLGFLFLFVPIILWVTTLAGITPVFEPKYVIGSVIGYAVMLTYLADLLVGRAYRARRSSLVPPGLRSLMVGGYVAACLAMPFFHVISNPGLPQADGRDDASFGHTSLPILCVWADDFVIRSHYHRGGRYLYPIDYAASMAPGNPPHDVSEQRLMETFQRHYPGKFQLVDGPAFLARVGEFLLFDRVGHRWSQIRLDPRDWDKTELGTVQGYGPGILVYHVIRKRPT